MNKTKAYGIALYKKDQNKTSILLCKSINSKNKWGLLKGVHEYKDFTAKKTAQREFKEESGIHVDTKLFEQYFFQDNPEKLIGIYLVNSSKIEGIDQYFDSDGELYRQYLSWENSKVKFFDIDNLPKIKKKQKYLVSEIIESLKEEI